MPSRAVALLAAALFACGGGPGNPPPPAVSTSSPTQPGELQPPDVTVSTVLPMPPTTGFGQVDEALRPFIDQAVEDLSSQIQVAREAVVVVSAETMVWPDGSLGCPEPGRSYTQVQVEGYLIRLLANDLIYNYHGGGSRQPFLCQVPGAR